MLFIHCMHLEHGADLARQITCNIVLSNKFCPYPCEEWMLTHCNWDKMAAILQMTFSNSFFVRKLLYFVSNFLKFVPKGPVNNGSDNGWASHGLSELKSHNKIIQMIDFYHHGLDIAVFHNAIFQALEDYIKCLYMCIRDRSLQLAFAINCFVHMISLYITNT